MNAVTDLPVTPPAPEPNVHGYVSSYVSPYGFVVGLQKRLAEWAVRLGTDRALPWAGLGIIGDLKLAAAILNLREFAEHLNTNGTPEQREWAAEILRNEETLQGVTQALADGGLRNFDQVAGVETLNRERDEARARLRAVRAVLEQAGVVDDATPDSDLPDLLRALLA